jgi:hypothetical protein
MEDDMIIDIPNENMSPATPPATPPANFQPPQLRRVRERNVSPTGSDESPRERETNRRSIRRQFRNNMNLSPIFDQIARTESPQPREFGLSQYPPYSTYSLNSTNPQSFSPNDLAFDVIEGTEVTIQSYLNEPGTESEQRFILHLNGEYICQSLKGMKLTNSYHENENDLNEFYECKDDTPSDWQGNSYIRDWLKPGGKGPLIKIMGPGGTNYLIEKPSFFWNGPVPEPRVFNMVELPYKIKKYISSFVLPIRNNFHNYGVDHCNQLSAERVYRLELMVPKENVGGKIGRKRKTQKKKKNKTRRKTQNQKQKRKNKKVTRRRKT